MKKIRGYLGVICGIVLVGCGMVNMSYAESSDEINNDGGGGNSSEDSGEEINVKLPELYIKAVNPGYTVDGQSNVGEMIEIERRDTDEPMSLKGVSIGYTNSSGNYSVLMEFPENSWIKGKSIILRLASAPDNEKAAVNYTKTLAMTAGIELKNGEEIVDAVCWTGKDECYKSFKSANPTTLVRNMETGEFEHLAEYEPKYDTESYYAEVIKERFPLTGSGRYFKGSVCTSCFHTCSYILQMTAWPRHTWRSNGY